MLQGTNFPPVLQRHGAKKNHANQQRIDCQIVIFYYNSHLRPDYIKLPCYCSPCVINTK